MFDINAIVNAAIASAVEARITEVLQQHANIVGALETRIAALENNPAQGVDVGASFSTDITLNAIIEALDKQEWFWEKMSGVFVSENDDELVLIKQRLGALEEAPTLVYEERRAIDNDIVEIKQRLGALEDKDEKVLDSDDVEAIVERALDDHCSTYNHDDYDDAVSKVEDVDFDDIITTDNLNDAINEALNGATVSIQV